MAVFDSKGRSVLFSLAGELRAPSADSLVQAEERHSQMFSDTIRWIPYSSFRSAQICIQDGLISKAKLEP